MDEALSRMFENLIGRVTGPMMFRLFLQPTMATLMGIKDGLRDARSGQPPYFWAVLDDPAHRRQLLHDGWKSVGKIFVLASVLDAVYQWIVQGWIYPGEIILVALILAIVPYLLVRGPVNRLARGSARPARSAPRP
jgi:hypothetical protein